MNLDTTRFADGPRLLADVGGTNARFAIETAPRQFRHAAIAIANPVEAGN